MTDNAANNDRIMRILKFPVSHEASSNANWDVATILTALLAVLTLDSLESSWAKLEAHFRNVCRSVGNSFCVGQWFEMIYADQEQNCSVLCLETNGSFTLFSLTVFIEILWINFWRPGNFFNLLKSDTFCKWKVGSFLLWMFRLRSSFSFDCA